MRPRRVLCAVDFTDSSKQAVELAARIADGGALALCHVFERERLVAEVGDLPGASHILSDLEAGSERELELWRREAAKIVPDTEGRSVGGRSAWEAIVTEAERYEADLVVVGSGARRRGLLGSVAERVIRHSPCSVLVVGGDARPPGKILCAVDFSPDARIAVLAAVDLAAARGASLTLINAFAAPALELVGAARAAAEASLRAWADDASKRTGGPVGMIVAEAPPAEAVIEAARTGGHDLIVTGTRGRTGIARALLGSVAERIVRDADRPVLIVRERA